MTEIVNAAAAARRAWLNSTCLDAPDYERRKRRFMWLKKLARPSCARKADGTVPRVGLWVFKKKEGL